SEEQFIRSENGVPQGGILSPLISNIALSVIEERYKRHVWPDRSRAARGSAWDEPEGQMAKGRVCRTRSAVVLTLVIAVGCRAGSSQPITSKGAEMPANQEGPIVTEQTYRASPRRVWKAITDPEQMKNWFFSPIAAFKPEVGFETKFVVNSDG